MTVATDQPGLLSQLTTSLQEWADVPKNFNGSNGRKLLDAYPDYPVYATVLYLAAVFYLPGFLEKRNLRFALKWPVALWNLFLSLVSTVGAYYTIQLCHEFVFVNRGFHKSCCELISFEDIAGAAGGGGGSENGLLTGSPVRHDYLYMDAAERQAILGSNYKGPRAYFIAVFMYLKTPELLDTVFLILQGKPVSFLHWFHHIATAVYCWHAGYTLIPAGVFFSTMNYFVHSIMYFYYFLVVLGFRKTIRPFAPVITLLQCTQMFLGVGITGYTYLQYWLSPEHTGGWFYALCSVLLSTIHVARQQVMHVVTNGSLLSSVELVPYKMEEHFIGCDTDTTNLRMGVMMYGSYCVLFGVLFKELYLDKRVNKKSIVLARHIEKPTTAAAASSSSSKPAMSIRGKNGEKKIDEKTNVSSD